MIRKKMTEYSVPLKNEPGTHFRATRVLAKAGVNLTAVHIQASGGISMLRFVSELEPSAVRRPLEAAGYEVFDQPVYEIEMSNTPGELSRLCRILDQEDIQIQEIYGRCDEEPRARLIVSVAQPEKASQVLGRSRETAPAAA